jgi:hypothetical protein
MESLLTQVSKETSRSFLSPHLLPTCDHRECEHNRCPKKSLWIEAFLSMLTVPSWAWAWIIFHLSGWIALSSSLIAHWSQSRFFCIAYQVFTAESPRFFPVCRYPHSSHLIHCPLVLLPVHFQPLRVNSVVAFCSMELLRHFILPRFGPCPVMWGWSCYIVALPNRHLSRCLLILSLWLEHLDLYQNFRKYLLNGRINGYTDTVLLFAGKYPPKLQ